ncbi:cytochrome P450 [Bailinhaonella thermotolerans]|uniref:Cytochrome P450 n=1 Tax=Bailinhaonella thermotolerans TaxID=1070861 RepID=A0A3A4B3E2_9ACTN|nr:cytochrome P450 [Bailinhaonella thermotolerans]
MDAVGAIDVIDPGLYAAGGIPHDRFRRLRAAAPVYRHAGEPEFWAVTRHADVVRVSRDSRTFSVRSRGAMFLEYTDEELAVQRSMMMNMDPPEHTRTRSLVNRGFTPRLTALLEPRLRAVCEELAGQALRRGEGDFVAEIAAPFPARVLCELMGIPAADRHRVEQWSNRLTGFDDPGASVEDAQAAAAEMFLYLDELVARRRQDPRDDLIGRLLLPGAYGEALTAAECNLLLIQIAVAGNETTRNAASGGMLAFFAHPAQWRRLLDDRSLLPAAVDEIVRWVSPVNQFRRTATRDTELGGQPIARGDKVVVFYSSANFDERVFADPGVFDIGRRPNPHVGFGGGGAHYCLGSHLARLQLSVLIETIADKMPGLAPAGPATRVRSNFINGVRSMPVRFR